MRYSRESICGAAALVVYGTVASVVALMLIFAP